MSIVVDAIIIVCVLAMFGIVMVFMIQPFLTSVTDEPVNFFEYQDNATSYFIGDFVCWMTGIGCT